MQPQPPVVLITRPEPAARRFAAQVADLGLSSVIAPLMQIVPVPHDADVVKAAHGLVITSENAIPFAGAGAGRPAICVGPRTAELAREAGFDVTQGPGDAARMMPLLTDLGPGWLHLRGTRVAAELPVPGLIVYDQQTLPLSPEAQQLLRGTAPVILPLFSPRSAFLAAQAIAGARPNDGPPLWLVPISAAADTAWDQGWVGPPAQPLGRKVAASPDAPAIRDVIAQLASGTDLPGAG